MYIPRGHLIYTNPTAIQHIYPKFLVSPQLNVRTIVSKIPLIRGTQKNCRRGVSPRWVHTLGIKVISDTLVRTFNRIICLEFKEDKKMSSVDYKSYNYEAAEAQGKLLTQFLEEIKFCDILSEVFVAISNYYTKYRSIPDISDNKQLYQLAGKIADFLYKINPNMSAEMEKPEYNQKLIAYGIFATLPLFQSCTHDPSSLRSVLLNQLDDYITFLYLAKQKAAIKSGGFIRYF